MKTLAWLPCTVEMENWRRIDEDTVHVYVSVFGPGFEGSGRVIVPISLRDNNSTGDAELFFMAAVSHLQIDFRVPEPKPSYAAKEGTNELKSSV